MNKQRSPEGKLVRVQASVTPECAAALDRHAKLRRSSRSGAVSDVITLGLRGLTRADPEDRLLRLERRLHDHMRLTARDLRIVEEFLLVQIRMLLSRLPETAHDRDPVARAAVEARLHDVIEEVSAQIVAGPRRDAPPPAAAEAA